MPEFSEEMMLEVSENITPKFSKVRFASVCSVQSDERRDRTDMTKNGGGVAQGVQEAQGVQDVRAPQEQHERGKQNGNGHRADGPSNGHIPAEIEQGKQNGNGHRAGGPPGGEWEVLAAREPEVGGKGNGNELGGAPELDEETEPRLPKVHVTPLEDVQPAVRVDHHETHAGTVGEKRIAGDQKRLGEQAQGIEQQKTVRLTQRGFLKSRGAGEQAQGIEQQKTVRLTQRGYLKSRGAGEQAQGIEQQKTVRLTQRGYLKSRGAGEQVERNGSSAHYRGRGNGRCCFTRTFKAERAR